MIFAEQPRCLRVAWALDGLFNAKTGYCNASNTYLADATGVGLKSVQKALADLEADGAIVRVATKQVGDQNWRAIYPAKSVMKVAGVTSTVEVGGHLHAAEVQNLSRKRPRMPKTQLDYARLAARPHHEGGGTNAAATEREGNIHEPLEPQPSRHAEGV
jgi:hypothetical protein